MIDAEGNLKAAYRYDPYGRLRGWTGPEADDNPFRFSTKLWLDFGPAFYRAHPKNRLGRPKGKVFEERGRIVANRRML